MGRSGNSPRGFEVSDSAAFAPKQEFSDPDCLGTIFVNDTSDLNVREAVARGKGYIVTADPDAIRALDSYPAVKRVSLTEAEHASAGRQATTKKPSGGSGGDDGGKS